MVTGLCFLSRCILALPSLLYPHPCEGICRIAKGELITKSDKTISYQLALNVLIYRQERTKEERTMKARIANKMAYLGAGAGLVLFAIFGIMPGTFIGGVMGLSLAGALLGTPVEAGVVARVIVAASMLTGVLAAGLIAVTVTSTIGWLLGTVVDALGRKEAKAAEA